VGCTVARALVTGAAGQDGSYLCELLLGKGYEVTALVRPSTTNTLRNIYHILDKLRVVRGDVRDINVIHGLAQQGYEEVYHLAALSHVGESFTNPHEVIEVNLGGTINLLEQLRRYSPSTKLYWAGTSEMLPNGDKPDFDTARLGARSPYAASKIAAYHMCDVYRQAYDMFITCGVAYNHESPRRGLNFVTQRLVQGVREFLRSGKPIKMGNPHARRDWHHAKDTVQGMYLAMHYDNVPYDFTFASGEEMSVEEFAVAVCKYYGVSVGDAVKWGEVEQRPLDVAALRGNPRKAEVWLGWHREYDFHRLVESMCEEV